MIDPYSDQDDSATERILQRPQELVDMLKETLFDIIFCPRLYLPQVHNQFDCSWDEKFVQIARLAMLRLSKDICSKHLLAAVDRKYVRGHDRTWSTHRAYPRARSSA